MMVNLPCLMVSCTNFLRPTCSYTECQLSFLTGSCPKERTTASYSSCLYLIFTDLLLTPRKLFSVDALPCFICWSCWDAVYFTLHRVYGVPIQNPARFQNSLEPSKALDSNAVFLLFMLPVLTSDPVLLYLLTSSSDCTLSLLLVLCKSPSVFYRLSQSVTASFLADYLFWSCSTHEVP